MTFVLGMILEGRTIAGWALRSISGVPCGQYFGAATKEEADAAAVAHIAACEECRRDLDIDTDGRV